VFELLRNGTAIKTITLDKSNDWMGFFDDLDKTDANGDDYLYEVHELGKWVNVETQGNSGEVIIKNLFLPKAVGETTSLSVYKKWADGLKEEAVTIQLLQNGKAVEGGTVALTEDNDWFCEFENLPKYDESGEEYKYSIEEVGGKWLYELTENSDGSITIMNKAKTTTTTTKTNEKPGVNKVVATKTGDNSDIAIYIALIAVSALGMLYLYSRKRRSQ
jgi:hypothetical protein